MICCLFLCVFLSSSSSSSSFSSFALHFPSIRPSMVRHQCGWAWYYDILIVECLHFPLVLSRKKNCIQNCLGRLSNSMVMTVRKRERNSYWMNNPVLFRSNKLFLALSAPNFMCLCLAFGIAVDLYALSCLNQPYIFLSYVFANGMRIEWYEHTFFGTM